MAADIHKRENSDHIEYRVRLYHRLLSLRIDRTRCIHCDICSLLCPQRALLIEADENGLEIYLDEHRCVLCEVCSYFCPADAIRLGFSDTAKDLLGCSEALPRLTQRIEVAAEKCPHRCEATTDSVQHWCRQLRQLVENRDQECPKHCFHCIETCPREVFREVDCHTQAEPRDCLRCGTCLDHCEYGSIQVNPLFSGHVLLDPDRCPADCDKCFQVCPVKLFQRENGRVTLLRDQCAFCGACVNVCDQDALHLERRAILLPDEPKPDQTRLWARLKQSLLSGLRPPAEEPDRARREAVD